MDFESVLFFLCFRIEQGKSDNRPASLRERRGDKSKRSRQVFLFPPAPHFNACCGECVLVHVVIHAGLAVPDAGVVTFDVCVAASLDGGALAGAAVDLPAVVGEVGDLGAAGAVFIAGGGDGADFLSSDGGLGAGDDTVEGGENHGPAEIRDEDGPDLDFGHVLEGGGGVGALGGHRWVLSFGVCSLSTSIE